MNTESIAPADTMRAESNASSSPRADAGLRLIGAVTAACLLVAAGVKAWGPTACGPDSEVAAALSHGGPLATGLELYRREFGRYPDSTRDLLDNHEGTQERGRAGPYVIDARSLLDPWGRPLRYKSPGVHNPEQYDLWSAGPDGLDGTADDIGNWKMRR